MDAIDGLVFRALDDDDIEGACRLSAEAGWNQVAADWQLMCRLGSGTAVVDRDAGLVATSMVLPHGPAFAWIAMILVTAGFRRRGIASALMRRALAVCAEQDRVAGLDAVNQHLILTPYRRAKLTPPPCFDGGCPGSPREGPARLRVALCVTRSEAAWEGPVGPPGQPGRRRNVGIRWGS